MNQLPIHGKRVYLSLIEHFQDLPGPRVDRTKHHDLIDVLAIAICTLLRGGDGFDDMEDFGHAKLDWFQTFLKLRSGIPGHDTFNRVFAALDPKAFLECFLRSTQCLRRRWRKKSPRWPAKRCAAPSTPIKAASMWSAPGPRTTNWCWAVENQLHWVLDVQMREDQSRAACAEPKHSDPLRAGGRRSATTLPRLRCAALDNPVAGIGSTR